MLLHCKFRCNCLDKIDIKETPNNEALVDALKDSQIDLNKHMKSVEKWIKKLIKAGANNNVDLIRYFVYLRVFTLSLDDLDSLSAVRLKLNTNSSAVDN